MRMKSKFQILLKRCYGEKYSNL